MSAGTRNNKSVGRGVRIPLELDEEVLRCCKQGNLSYSQWVIRAIREKITPTTKTVTQDKGDLYDLEFNERFSFLNKKKK